MNRSLFALALSEAVRATYSMSFDEAVAQVDALELISGDVIGDKPGDIVHWTSNALQLLDDAENGPSVEFIVSVTDGYVEDDVFIYVRKKLKPLDWEIPDAEVNAQLLEAFEELERLRQAKGTEGDRG